MYGPDWSSFYDFWNWVLGICCVIFNLCLAVIGAEALAQIIERTRK